jgi:hypothetical protein
MSPETKASWLKDEYLLLQKVYGDYDARVITIKGWSATIGMAAIGGGFYQSRYLWLFAAGAALIFWILEALWKSFQYLYAQRIELLEATFRSESFETVAPFQIYSSWFEQFQASGLQLARNMCMGLVVFPHAVTLLAGVVLFGAESLDLLAVPRK